LLQVRRYGRDISTTDGPGQGRDFPLVFDALEHAFAKTNKHGTGLGRRNAAVGEHSETDAHQACDQVTRDGCSRVVENFVLGLDCIDVTTQVTNQSAGYAFGGGISFRTPVNTAQNFWISDGRTEGM
jgi:hypothetical protein